MNKNCLITENSDNYFSFFTDFLNGKMDFEATFSDYQANSKLIMHEDTIFSLSNDYFNVWDLKTFPDVTIVETIYIHYIGLMDFSLNFNKEAVMVINNNGDGEMSVLGLILKKMERKRGLKMMRKNKNLEVFTFFEERKNESEILNLSQFLVNSNEREKFQQYDLIIEVLLFINY